MIRYEQKKECRGDILEERSRGEVTSFSGNGTGMMIGTIGTVGTIGDG